MSRVEARMTASVAPSNTEIDGESDPTRKKILGAMQRILGGYPKHVPPTATSVAQLAKEAGVGRHNLYQAHADLRERFEYLRDKAQQPTEKEAELRELLDRAKTEIVRLQSLQSDASKSARNWKGLSELLARAINSLQEELHKEQIKARRLAKRIEKLETATGGHSVLLLHRGAREDG